MPKQEQIHPDKEPRSSKTDQDFSFWYNPDFWKGKKGKTSSKELADHIGEKEAVNLILNEVYSGNPPIDKLSGNCQLEFKFL